MTASTPTPERREPRDELAPSWPVVLLSPLWTPHPVFHRLHHHFTGDELPAGRTSYQDRIAADMPDLPWKVTARETGCGILLHVHLWLDECGRPPIASQEWEIDRSVVELRLDQAEAFARPCRNCWRRPRD